MKKALFIILIVTLFSCKKEEEVPSYSEIPSINFISVEFSKGVNSLDYNIITVKLLFYYTDGDSNLGGNYYMSNGRINEESEYEYDLVLEMYKKINEELIPVDMHWHPMYYYFPEVFKSEIDGYPVKINPYNRVEGEIELTLEFYESYPLFSVNDTLNFKVQILDRDGNYSNISELEQVYKNID